MSIGNPGARAQSPAGAKNLPMINDVIDERIMFGDISSKNRYRGGL